MGFNVRLTRAGHKGLLSGILGGRMSGVAVLRAMSSSGSARDVRSLVNLSDTASTNRVLNLVSVAKLHGQSDDYYERPLFCDAIFNRAIIVKHTIRPHEREYFSRFRRTATKIIIPFDTSELRLGGRAIFIGQMGWEGYLRQHLPLDAPGRSRDIDVLNLLDELPSLDPFLVREHLARIGVHPAPCYLQITPSDVEKMTQFVNEEIGRLVAVAFGSMPGRRQAADRLTGKILSHSLDKELSPLQATLRLSNDEFAEGLFSWRGFLYFKWRLQNLRAELRGVLQGIQTYIPRGPWDQTMRDYIETARPRLIRMIMAAATAVAETLEIYNRAYRRLIEELDPMAFREFLLNGPGMFFELGERIGVLGHIQSFWGYRMGIRGTPLTPLEFMELLVDFEESLSGRELDEYAIAI